MKSNTTHKIGGKIVYAREINNAICSFLICIEEVYTEYSLHSEEPTTIGLKEQVNDKPMLNCQGMPDVLDDSETYLQIKNVKRYKATDSFLLKLVRTM